MLEFITGSEKSLSYLKEISGINKQMKEKQNASGSITEDITKELFPLHFYLKMNIYVCPV